MNCQQLNNIELEEVLASLGHLPTRKRKKKLGISILLPTRTKPLLNLIYPETSGIFFQKVSAGTTLILSENISNVQLVTH